MKGPVVRVVTLALDLHTIKGHTEEVSHVTLVETLVHQSLRGGIAGSAKLTFVTLVHHLL